VVPSPLTGEANHTDVAGGVNRTAFDFFGPAKGLDLLNFRRAAYVHEVQGLETPLAGSLDST
jgi:hypothetical protein